MKQLLSIFAFVFVITGCSEYSRVLKSKDLNLKYEKAIEYYQAKQYFKAYPLLEELSIIYRGTAKSELIDYYLAYCDYYTGDLMYAAHRFKRFAQTYPRSQYAEECSFMSAYCYYRNSPAYSLDQTNTKQAINQLQLFISQYPTSTYTDSCYVLMDKLHFKLEKKAFEIARQYFHMELYKSASIAFENFISDYPSSILIEEAFFMLLKSKYKLVVNSIPDKKAERISQLTDTYIKFVDYFPNSKHIKEAENIYTKVLKEQKANNKKS